MLFSLLTAHLLLSCFASAQLPVFPRQRYLTESFTAPDLDIQRSGATEPGYLFFGPVGNGTSSQAPLIMTDTNDLIWHGPDGGVPQNIQVQQVDGKPHLTYWSGYGAVVTTFGHGYGYIVMLDQKYRVAYNICLSDLDLVTPNTTLYPGTLEKACYLDNHESYVTPQGTVLATAYNVTQYDLSPVGGSPNGWIFDALFYEIDIKTNEVLFKWSALEHIPITTSNYVNTTGDLSNRLTIGGVTYGGSQSNPWDYFHINSVQPVDGGYLVNSRYTWAFYKIAAGSGSVVWRMEGSNGGDFTFLDPIYYAWQHQPRLFDVAKNKFSITLFNNDNLRFIGNGTNATSGLDLSVNTRTKKVSLARRLLDPAEQIYAVAQGAYQRLANGHVLIGYGTYPIMKEFNAAGKRVLRVVFGNIFGPSTVVGYRAFREQWSATPYYPPKVYASLDASNNTNIYMSWNGATEYDGWTIYAGQDETSLAAISHLPRKGFETQHIDGQSYQFVRAAATRNGKVMRKSLTVQVQSQ